MATSAFKSTSKRDTFNSTGTSDSNSSSRRPQPHRRRSQSVSAVARVHSNLIDVSAEFSNKRDNPLFWASSNSPPDAENSQENVDCRSVGDGSKAASIGNSTSDSGRRSTSRKAGGISSVAEQRGRSVNRNGGTTGGIGRSVSRGPRRSVSRGPHRPAYESEKEPGVNGRKRNEISGIASEARKINSLGRRAGVGAATLDACRSTEISDDETASSLHISRYEDGMSTSSLSEVEEKTIKAVCEDMKAHKTGGEVYETVCSEVRRSLSDIQNDLEIAFLRSNVNVDLVNPGSAGSVVDIRLDYAEKLDKIAEQAQKLRTKLAMEGHNKCELNKLLIPDSKTDSPPRSRPGRRRSNERRRMSKCLTEEARAYFDECVSISTFDGSDFSASEDPSPCADEACISEATDVSVSKGCNRDLPLHDIDTCFNNKQSGQSCSRSTPTTNSGTDELRLIEGQYIQRFNGARSSDQLQFSFARNKPELRADQDIKSYVGNFKRDAVHVDANNNSRSRSDYDATEYRLRGYTERLLFDKVLHNSSRESWGLHLCGGAMPVSLFPFSSAS